MVTGDGWSDADWAPIWVFISAFGRLGLKLNPSLTCYGPFGGHVRWCQMAFNLSGRFVKACILWVPCRQAKSTLFCMIYCTELLGKVWKIPTNTLFQMGWKVWPVKVDIWWAGYENGLIVLTVVFYKVHSRQKYKPCDWWLNEKQPLRERFMIKEPKKSHLKYPITY